MDVWMFRPPVLVGERVVWLGSGSGLPQGGVVRWIGKLPEMGPDWTVGLELDNPLPYGGIDGMWGHRYLFTCEPKHGLLVPVTKTIRERDLLCWPYDSIGSSLHQHGNAPVALEPAVQHKALPAAPQSLARKPVTSQPRPVARRKKRLQILASKTLSVIPEPKESECSEDNASQCHRNRDICTPHYGSLKSVNTYRTCKSGELSDYCQWYDISEDELYEFQDCNSDIYEPIDIRDQKDCDISSIDLICESEVDNKNNNELTTVVHNNGGVEVEIMTELKGQPHCNNQDDDFSFEDTVIVADGLYSSVTPNTSTGSSSHRGKGASGFFSFLHWFKKGKDDNGDSSAANEKVKDYVEGIVLPSTPSSIHLIRTQSSSCGSIDTLFSTATVNSFSFVSPTSYGSASLPEKRIAIGPDTDTYRKRLVYTERTQELDKNLTLRKKYHLFGSDTQLKSIVNTPESSPLIKRKYWNVVTCEVKEERKSKPSSPPGSSNSTFGRKKRRAPAPPDFPKSLYNDYSLPSSWAHEGKVQGKSMDSGDAAIVKKPCHRRTVSDSSKDKKAGAYCHVKGKRRAPPPPTQSSDLEQQNGSTLERFRSQFASFGRKKRPAPQPPTVQDKPKEEEVKRKKDQETQSNFQLEEGSKSTTKLSPEEKERLIANIAKLKVHANRKSMGSPPSSPKGLHLNFPSSVEQIVCNDSLKLERGVLKPNKKLSKMELGASETKPAPVSPRPWYKRNLTKDMSIKSLEKKKDRDKEKEEDWMPEVGYPRIDSTVILSDGNSTSSKFNIFAKLDKSDEKKREGDKRKSQVSMLANISELDREAAEIVQKEQAREQALMAAYNAKFYSYPDVPSCNRKGIELLQDVVDEPVSENVEVPKRSSAKELISLFNAIGNVTKVTVNSALFSKDGSSFFSREGIEKRFSFMGESVKTSEEQVVTNKSNSYVQEVQQRRQYGVIDFDEPLLKSPSTKKKHTTGVNGTNVSPDVSDIRTKEVEDEKSSKVQAIYEANKSRRHHSPSPSIPTIVEKSESTTPASTINPGSYLDNIVVVGPTEVIPGTPAPEALQHAKRLTIWGCPRCTLENPRWKLTCDACGRWRPCVSDEKLESARSAALEESKELSDADSQNKLKEGKVTIDWEEELKRYFPSVPKAAPSKTQTKNKTDSKDNFQTKDEGDASQGNTEKINKDYLYKTDTTVLKIDNNKLPLTSENLRNVKYIISEATTVNKPIVNSAMPSMFIGGRTKQDEKKQKVSQINVMKVTATSAVQTKGIDEVLSGKEPDIDEVRKARIAFFNRTSEEEQEYISQTDNVLESKTNVIAQGDSISQVKSDGIYSGRLKLPKDANEKLKLKEMLKEMKDSLPKHPKTNSAVGVVKSSETVRSSISFDDNTNKYNAGFNISTSDSKISANYNDPVDGHQHGAIKKTPGDLSKSTEHNSFAVNGFELDDMKYIKIKSPMEDNRVEALFITTKTVYEDVKVKKANLPKPMKVSTSVQTSSVVRKVAAATGGTELPTREDGTNCNNALPVTVEELSTPRMNEGVLYTSPSKQVPHIGTRTFKLIRARDFATIEATKTNSEIGAAHLYANLPPSPINLPSIQQQSTTAQKIIGSHPVFPPQQPVSPLLVSKNHKPGSSEKCESESRSEEKEKETKVGRVVEVRQTMGSPQTTSGMTSPSREAGDATSEVSSYSLASVGSVSEDNSEVERLTAQLSLPKGLAEFKANLQAAPPEQNMNTLAVNRLLRRLEAAIAGGQHHQAAGLAKDLARLKISCSVTRQRRSLDSSPASITVDMYVEDKVSHQGPIPLQVTSIMTVAQLKQKVEHEFEIPAGVQRWILGKLLASDDTKTLEDHNVNTSGCPMFLYLVAPDGDNESEAATSSKQSEPEEPVQDPALTNKGEKGGGWYYNNEEDHYSFCEDTESELTENDDDDEVSRGSKSPANQPEIPPKNIEVEKVDVVEEEEEDEEEEDEGEDEEEEESDEPALISASAVIIHDRPTVVEPIVAQMVERPVVNQSPRPFRPVGSTSGIVEPEAKGPVPQLQPTTGTLKLGWKCPTCTLVNSPTRPGCAACTTERPFQYVVPVEYRANQQELQRMQQEQQLETQMHQVAAQEAEKQHQHYQQLVNLDNTELVPNVEAFDCSVCLVPYAACEGVVLRECLHTFCRPCLVNTVQFNEEAEVKCPYRDSDYACDSVLQEREIKALVPPHVYEKHLAKSVTQAENKIGNAFHCKTPDCRGWCIFEDNVNEFRCPVCRIINCLTCQAIHDGINCKQYQEQVKQQSETNAEARRTKEMLEEMVVRGEAMACPTCQVVLMKKWGCDWLRCSMCKTEICWVTRGPRWGPGGKGDTTGGCQCGLNGVKCHPRCNYCH